ncbi:MAG: GyrI-like domain-containing protein [Ginsengibacter sp.]
MKKLLLVLISICIISFASVYIFIPSKITFSKVFILKTKTSIANRLLLNENYWYKWWPSPTVDKKIGLDKNHFAYENYNYSLNKKMINTGEVTISGENISLKSLLSIISMNSDSIVINWNSEMPKATYPLARIKSYLKAKRIKNSMTAILENFQSFLNKTENIYGFSIGQMQVKDTLLISTRFTSAVYPSTEDVYKEINMLKKYVAQEHATETGYPMLNIIHDSSNYRAMIAIPINSAIPVKNNYEIKRMVAGKILVAQISGGEASAKEAMKQLVYFLQDNHISSPAIPFESLVTDRSTEHDSSKWVTKIYYPIF